MSDYSHILKLLDEYIALLSSPEFDVNMRLNSNLTSDDIQTMILTVRVIKNLINAEMIKELAIMGAEMEKNAKH